MSFESYSDNLLAGRVGYRPPPLPAPAVTFTPGSDHNVVDPNEQLKMEMNRARFVDPIRQSNNTQSALAAAQGQIPIDIERARRMMPIDIEKARQMSEAGLGAYATKREIDTKSALTQSAGEHDLQYKFDLKRTLDLEPKKADAFIDRLKKTLGVQVASRLDEARKAGPIALANEVELIKQTSGPKALAAVHMAEKLLEHDVTKLKRMGAAQIDVELDGLARLFDEQTRKELDRIRLLAPEKRQQALLDLESRFGPEHRMNIAKWGLGMAELATRSQYDKDAASVASQRGITASALANTRSVTAATVANDRLNTRATETRTRKLADDISALAGITGQNPGPLPKSEAELQNLRMRMHTQIGQIASSERGWTESQRIATQEYLKQQQEYIDTLESKTPEVIRLAEIEALNQWPGDEYSKQRAEYLAKKRYENDLFIYEARNNLNRLISQLKVSPPVPATQPRQQTTGDIFNDPNVTISDGAGTDTTNVIDSIIEGE